MVRRYISLRASCAGLSAGPGESAAQLRVRSPNRAVGHSGTVARDTRRLRADSGTPSRSRPLAATPSLAPPAGKGPASASTWARSLAVPALAAAERQSLELQLQSWDGAGPGPPRAPCVAARRPRGPLGGPAAGGVRLGVRAGLAGKCRCFPSACASVPVHARALRLPVTATRVGDRGAACGPTGRKRIWLADSDHHWTADAPGMCNIVTLEWDA